MPAGWRPSGRATGATAARPVPRRRPGGGPIPAVRREHDPTADSVAAVGGAALAGGRGHGSGEGSRGHFKPYHAVNVPKSLNLEVAFHGGAKPKTTAMLRNIPNRYTQASLLREIDAAGFAGTYDFFYLPMDTHNRTNVGYAFINFVAPSDMELFTKTFSGYNFKDHASQKIARVSPAHLQGFYENIQHFSNRAVAHARNSAYRPIVVVEGRHKDLCEVFAPTFFDGHTDVQPGLDPTAEEFVPCFVDETAAFLAAELPGSSCGPFIPIDWQGCTLTNPYLPSDVCASLNLARNAADMIGHEVGAQPVGPVVGPPAEWAQGSAEIGLSFGQARRGFEELVSQWLMQADAKPHETSSTEGDSRTPSSGSPRLASPTGSVNKMPPGLKMLEHYAGGQTPRTNRTLLSSFRVGL